MRLISWQYLGLTSNKPEMAGIVADENSAKPNEKISSLLGNQPPLPRLKGLDNEIYILCYRARWDTNVPV